LELKQQNGGYMKSTYEYNFRFECRNELLELGT